MKSFPTLCLCLKTLRWWWGGAKTICPPGFPKADDGPGVDEDVAAELTSAGLGGIAATPASLTTSSWELAGRSAIGVEYPTGGGIGSSRGVPPALGTKVTTSFPAITARGWLDGGSAPSPSGPSENGYQHIFIRMSKINIYINKINV